MIKKYSLLTAITLLGAMFAQTASANASPETHAEIFKKLDTDGNGVLTIEEVQSNDDLAESFDNGDANNDGKIDMTEFQAMEVTDE